MPVVEVEQGGQGVATQLGQSVRGCEEVAVQDDSDQHDEKSGHQAPHPMPPESGEADAGVLAVLGHQETGDQEAGKDEEDVDAEEPSACPREPTVKEEDQDNAEGPDAVQGGDASEMRLRGPYGRVPVFPRRPGCGPDLHSCSHARIVAP